MRLTVGNAVPTVVLAMRSGEAGHLNCALAMARGLREAGLRVEFLGPETGLPRVEDQGFAVRKIGERVLPLDLRCDLLVIDDAMPEAIIVALGHEQDCVALSTTLPRNTDFPPFWSSALPDSAALSRMINHMRWGVESAMAAPLRGIARGFRSDLAPWRAALAGLRAAGVDLGPLLRHFRTRVPLLVACPSEFEFRQPCLPSCRKYEYVEPCVDRLRQDTPFDWPEFAAGNVRICAALGSEPLNVHQRLVGRLIAIMHRRSDWRLVLAGGTAWRACTDLPPNVLAERSIPQIEVLSASTIMITHCGLNSVKEAITMGVPMIGVPARRDQPSVGARLQHHRLGQVLPLGIAEKDLELAIEEVSLQQGYKKNVEAMRSVFETYARQAPGTAIVAARARDNFDRRQLLGLGIQALELMIETTAGEVEEVPA